MNIDDKFIEDLMQWAAGDAGGGEGDPIETPQNIRDYIDTQWQNMGTFYNDPGDLPSTAEERGGTFYNPYDMFQHWLSSGLLGFDSSGNVVPSPLINILVDTDIDGEPYYTVWIGYED